MNMVYVHDIVKRNEENASLLVFSDWSAQIMNMVYIHDIINIRKIICINVLIYMILPSSIKITKTKGIIEIHSKIGG